RDMGKARRIVKTLNFRKEDFQLFKELVNRTSWEMVLRDKGTEESWQIFTDAFHKAQELSVPRYKKSGNQDRLVKLKSKRELHRQWKQGQVSWEEYSDAAQLCRDGVRRAKAQLQLNLVRDAKNNKKGFYRYMNQKGKVKESVPHLMNKNGGLVSTDEEKAEVLNNIFASAFTGNLSPHPSQADGPQDGDQKDKAFPTEMEDQV
ncbi:hypothetical protein N336_00311, partial [Phalacrocorax carbo]